MSVPGVVHPVPRTAHEHALAMFHTHTNLIFYSLLRFFLFENLNKIGLTRQQYNYEWRLPRDNVLEWPAAGG